MTGRENTVAPKERVNIVYKPSTGDAQEEIELPFKLLIPGEWTSRPDDTPLEERKSVDINKDNFDDVLAEQSVSANFDVEDVLSETKEGEPTPSMNIDLEFSKLADFSPDNVARKVPELQTLLQIRELLVALKGPMGNVREFRERLAQLISDPEAVNAALKCLNASEVPIDPDAKTPDSSHSPEASGASPSEDGPSEDGPSSSDQD